MTDQTQLTDQQTHDTEERNIELITQAQALRITDDLDNQRAANMLTTCAAYEREVKKMTGPVVKAAHATHKAAKAQEEAFLAPIEEAKQLVQARMAEYAMKREAEEREQARLIAEAEAEEAEKDRLERAAEQTALGKTDQAERILAEPDPPQQAVAERMTKPKGVSIRVSWDVEIEDVALIPRAFMTPDVSRIRAAVNKSKGVLTIPGVKVTERRTPFARKTKGA